MILYYSKYLRTFNIIGSNRYRAFLSYLLKVDDLAIFFEIVTIIYQKIILHPKLAKIFSLFNINELKYFISKYYNWIRLELKFFNDYSIKSLIFKKFFIFLMINHLNQTFLKFNNKYNKIFQSEYSSSEFFYLILDTFCVSFKSKKFKNKFNISRFNSLKFKSKYQLLNISSNLRKLIKSEYKSYFSKKMLFFQNDFLRRIQKPFQNSFFIVGEGCDFYPGILHLIINLK